MNASGFLGLSYLIWALLCLAIAAVFGFVWPQKKAHKDTAPVRYFILRWFHALVWLLLAVGLAIRGLTGSGLGNPVALAALPVYLVFLGALLAPKQPKGQT